MTLLLICFPCRTTIHQVPSVNERTFRSSFAESTRMPRRMYVLWTTHRAPFSRWKKISFIWGVGTAAHCCGDFSVPAPQPLNRRLHEAGLPSLQDCIIPGINMKGAAPIFYKVGVTTADLVRAIERGQYPAQATCAPCSPMNVLSGGGYGTTG